MTAHWHPLLQLLVISLAAARVTALVTRDRIAEPVRGRFLAWRSRRGGDDGYLAFLVTCDWCAGWWVALGWWLAWWRWPIGTTFWAVPWAVAMLAWWLGASWVEED